MNPTSELAPEVHRLPAPKSAVTGLLVSLGVHVFLLIALSFVVFKAPLAQLQMVVDTAFNEERLQEEFTQEVEQSTEVAETVNFIAGSQVAGTSAAGGGGGGGTGGVVARQRLDDAQSLKEPDVKVNIGAMSVPGLNIIGKDLGSGQVSGETGRVVAGYGAALGQMTQELVRMMRESKVLVVWLFDESESMRDDQKEIRERFHKVYEELGLVQKREGKSKPSDDALLTSVMSFGKGISEHTVPMKPTSNSDEIKKAIDKIPEDESGVENTCAAITAAVRKYQQMAARSKRKLVLIVVTDESGDDGEQIEETIHLCKNAEAPVYVLGHYSVFGYPYARTKWIDPKFGLTHWLTINRGPETPYPECLQFDGLHRRWDVFSSGFGPYEQVRIAKQTGGIFFMLPGNEDNLGGVGSLEQRKYELLDMKEYLPDLSSRMEYAKDRDSHKFRAVQWQVVQELNPHDPRKELEMREIWYSIDSAAFALEGKATFERAIRVMGLLNEAVKRLDTVKKLRDKEPSERWRANYDLMHAQCLAYRVRLFQLLLSLDQHQTKKPRPTSEKSNVWNIHRVPELLEPTKEQVKQTKVDLDELKRQNELARAEYQTVIENHPRTPYARRAQWELQHGFGMKFAEGFRDPNYERAKDIKLPKQ